MRRRPGSPFPTILSGCFSLVRAAARTSGSNVPTWERVTAGRVSESRVASVSICTSFESRTERPRVLPPR
jgi:hypothetical protein